MSYSSLATVQIWSPHKTSPRNHGIDSVAIHTMAGNMTAESCGTWFQNPSANASSNYGIDSNGTVGVYVDESDRSWCTSSRGVDNRAVTIEVASTTTSEPYECTGEAYESLIKLLVDICQRNNIASLKWKDDKTYATIAAQGGPVDEQNMFVHRWFNTSKPCPGQYLFERQGQIANEVNKRLKNGESYADGSSEKKSDTTYDVNTGETTSTDSATATRSGTSVQLTINWEVFNPYLVRLDRNTQIGSYSMLKDAKVLGAVVEAGYRYHANGVQTDKFESPEVKHQVTSLQDCKLGYGFYTVCRARDVVQAKEEMFHFSFVIRRYPPTMGAWLELDLGHNTDTNNLIIERYKKELVRLGFTGKMGLICTRDMLSYFDWDTYQQDFFLWLVESIESTDELDQLLDPVFFDVDGEG